MGAWFLGTFLFSVPAFWFYDPLLNHAAYVLGGGHDTRVGVGAVLEILLAISGIATAVVIFPIAKRVNESVALGYVASRTVESILILVGVLSLLSVVALRQDLSTSVQGPGQAPLVDVARSLLAVHDQTALLGPQFCAGLGNGILLGYLMWRSRLLPRPMVLVGLIGGPLAVPRRCRSRRGRLGHQRRVPRRPHRPRGPLGALTQHLAGHEGLPTLTRPHRPTVSRSHVGQVAPRTARPRVLDARGWVRAHTQHRRWTCPADASSRLAGSRSSPPTDSRRWS